LKKPSFLQFFRLFFFFFAEFENNQRKTRQLEGMARAKLEAKYSGRKFVITNKLKAKLKNLIYKRKYTK